LAELDRGLKSRVTVYERNFYCAVDKHCRTRYGCRLTEFFQVGKNYALCFRAVVGAPPLPNEIAGAKYVQAPVKLVLSCGRSGVLTPGLAEYLRVELLVGRSGD